MPQKTNKKAKPSQLAKSRRPTTREQVLALDAHKQARKEIESSFSKLDTNSLEQLHLRSTYHLLPRPVPAHIATFSFERFGAAEDQEAAKSYRGRASEEDNSQRDHAGRVELTLPKRPRWRPEGMTKKEVESNEREVFRAWLATTDTIVQRAFEAQRHASGLFEGQEDYTVEPGKALVGSLYERNLEVFRQLWRVCERSDIICVLLDARCPPLHIPPSLQAFLHRFARFKTLLILTKADLVPAALVEAWRVWLAQRFPGWEVVVTEAYRKTGTKEGQGSRMHHTPHLAPESRTALFTALRQAHQQLITPPPNVRGDPERLSKWVPPCPTEVDWDAVEARQGPGRDALPNGKPRAAASETAKDGRAPTNDFLTIGLIGQPNVGKSSLLNALVGEKVVRASKTPGKTKHFQTHFLARDVRLCDSPGLVFPSLVGMEMQVLGAILPISQVQAVSSCVRFAADHLPLEQILDLDLPTGDDAAPQPSQHSQPSQMSRMPLPHSRAPTNAQHKIGPSQQQQPKWTSTLILEALARRHNYKTAKAGRWDIGRAGNGLMRMLAEGRIRWAFRPPPRSASTSTSSSSESVDATGAAAPGTSATSENDKQPTAQSGSGMEQGLIGDAELDARVRAGLGIWLGHFDSENETGTGTEAKGMGGMMRGDGEEEEEEEEEDDDDAEEEEGNATRSRRNGRSVHFERDMSKGDEDEDEDEDGRKEEEEDEGESEEEEEEEEEDAQSKRGMGPPSSLFAALAIEEGEDIDEEEDESSEEEENGDEKDEDGNREG